MRTAAVDGVSALLIFLLLQLFLFSFSSLVSYEWRVPSFELSLLLPTAGPTGPPKPSCRLLEQWWLHAIHVVRGFTHGAVHRIVTGSHVRQQPARELSLGSPCRVAAAPLASLDSAGQFFTAPYLDKHKLPSLIKYLFDSCWYIYNLTSGNDFVVAMNIAIEQFVIPKAILSLSEIVDIPNAASVGDMAFTPKRCEGTIIGMHSRKHHPCIIHLTLNVPWTIIPIDPHSVHRHVVIVVGVQKLHYSA